VTGQRLHETFGRRAVRGDQPKILASALAAIRPGRPVAAFDLDSTVLDNKARQARIVREFARERALERLAECPPSAVVSWDLRDTMRLCGLPEAEAHALYPDIKEYWRVRFFTSEYCRDDEPVPGAASFLRRVLEAGGEILYLTGRHAGMGPGTVESFARAGFPLPDGKRTQLWLKPLLEQDDDAWKEECHARLLAMSGIAAAFDNEPTHVNAYKRSFPDAVVVHLDRDHSGRPVHVLESIPSITDFVL
jgi:hypothetical protein